MHFRLVTYNIHKAIGGIDRRYRPERVAEVLAHCNPDLVLLQEVDDDVPRSRHDRQVDLLAEQLGLPHRAYQRNVRLRRGHYGNAILSRLALDSVEEINLTLPLKKRRGAMVARCHFRQEGHERTLMLVNVHLGLAAYERQMQLRRLLAVDTIKHVRHDSPIVIAGDYNDPWGRLGRRTLIPAGFTPAGHRIRTFPAALPLRPLDRVFFRGDLVLNHIFASRTNVARQASDHLPLVADFEIAGLPE